MFNKSKLLPWEATPVPQAREYSKKEAWETMPEEMWDYLHSLPEFDEKVFFEVTGLRDKGELKSKLAL
jgi:hypothetical protein